MNPTPSDASLRHILESHWRADAQANPDFRAGVWKQIQALQSPRTWRAWLQGHAPAVTGLALACLSVSVGTAVWAANRQERNRQVAAYVASLYPLAHLQNGDRP